jgi:hypothetical protein
MTTALTAYYTDSRDKLMPAGAHWAWNHLPITYFSIYPKDPFDPRTQLEGSITKAWGLYFLSYVGNTFPLETMMLHKDTFLDFMNRPSGTGDNSKQAGFGWMPSLGMNGVYVGGTYSFGAFRGQYDCNHPGHPWGHPDPAGNPKVSGGQFYVRFAGDVRYPSSIITIASARGGDISGSGFFGWGANRPDSGTIRPGYFLVMPPKPHPMGRQLGPVPWTIAGSGWTNNGNTFDPRALPSSWGNLDMRYSQRAVTSKFDGSVKMQSIENLRDMRQWANMASSPDWQFPNPGNIAAIKW